MGPDILQLLLLANVFLLGVVVSIAARHIREHGHKSPTHQNSILSDELRQELSIAAKDHLLQALDSSSAAMSNEMNTTAKNLNRYLAEAGTEILENEMIVFRRNIELIRKRIEAEAASSHSHITARQTSLDNELQLRRDELNERLAEHQSRLEASLSKSLESIQTTLTQRQELFTQKIAEREQALDVRLDEEIAKERELLLHQIDVKLGDAMGSFLVEALGSNVDLGAQTPYLLELLETHKEELKREVQSNG